MGSSEAQLMRDQMISQFESQKEPLDSNTEVGLIKNFLRISKDPELSLPIASRKKLLVFWSQSYFS